MINQSNPDSRRVTLGEGVHSGADALSGGRDASKQLPSSAPASATEEWVNEGGSLRPAADAVSFAFPSRSQKASADTADGCRERAASDSVEAAAMDTANGRLKLEHSAASWTARADLLQRLEDNFETRRTAAFAAWQREDAREASCLSVSLMEAQDVRL